ncbi:hypothetical protein [Caminibacter pacificus]|uniref:DUF1963 domain-containing protein n=1 Tax=Caminibacter pacificus TaxID=1424653 RepID=A0AAJ4RC84_9BACT|nr:hypothetical protein [Caminibacter pacificus]QCI28005.1 hypothetical protein C6V80_03210 [Caminibacter pacificus]ROR39808.1 hypothetical protein EDC58_0783 [Caminibacter pacificus]
MKLRELGVKFTTYQKLNYPENLGKRTKFGGDPEWIQNDQTPICPKCKNKMVFVSQIDSFDYNGYPTEEAEYIFGDVGMIYVFFCFECLETESVFQCY